jgi:sugar fermentation stimulation protein A
MNTLIKALEHGRAAVCFIIQRDDALEWQPNAPMDPDFTESIRKAVENGVEAYAYTCKINLDETTIQRRVPINLE